MPFLPRPLLLRVLAASLPVAFLTAAENPAPPPQPAGAPSASPARPREEMVNQLMLPDADIDTMLTALEQLTGRMIIRPQQLTTATYNLKIKSPVTKAEAIVAIETSLALNGIGLSPLGDKYLKVINLQVVKQEAPELITGSAFSQPATGKPAAKIFQLEFARAQEVQAQIAGSLNPLYGGAVVLQNANALLITDSISNLQRAELLLQTIDKPFTSGTKPKFYQLRDAKASDLVNKLRGIITGPLQQQMGTATSYSADDRTNQIILITDPRQHAFFDDLIERLDRKADPNTRTEVIYLKHAKATDVVNVLSKIISGTTTALQRQGSASVRPGQTPTPATPAAPAAPTVVSATNAANAEGANEFSALMTVVNDDRSNAVVVFGTADDIRLVRALIDKLDIVLPQVRIEVVIAEVTLDDQSASGISALGLKVDGDKLIGFSGSTVGASVSNGTIKRPGATGPLDLAAEISINTTPRKRQNSITTVPTVVTSHGKQAKFFNGETRPVVTGTIQSAAGVSTGLASSSTVTQQQIGTTLTVTPFIGVDGAVQLDMVQAVEDVTGEVLVDQNKQYVIGRRESTNYVSAKSGDIIVIGGFRKNSKLSSSSRFGPIPIIGDLLGSRSKGDTASELVFFVRPVVLANNPVVDNAEALRRIDAWPSRDQVKQEIDPRFVPPKKSILEKILP
ncbi:MAG: type II secretory pathway, component PulD [Opitutaceae bacterium]|jgi:general secretion pathway protein D|nr:type II secretory pathway, component PulD [Opitutaceae bacterium]